MKTYQSEMKWGILISYEIKPQFVLVTWLGNSYETHKFIGYTMAEIKRLARNKAKERAKL